MSEDLNIDDILKQLSSPEMSDTLKGLFDGLSSDSGDGSSDFSNILEALSNNINTSKLELLTGLRPYLSEKRQKKIDKCKNFVSILSALSIINSLSKD